MGFFTTTPFVGVEEQNPFHHGRADECFHDWMEADDEISLDFHPLTTPNDNIIHTLALDEIRMKLVGASIVVGLAWWMKKSKYLGSKLGLALSSRHG